MESLGIVFRKEEDMEIKGNFYSNFFVPEQVNEIRRGSISRLICDNADDVKSMQPRGFEQISHK
jgi:hypothetical protein